jgi:hypothetical protein
MLSRKEKKRFSAKEDSNKNCHSKVMGFFIHLDLFFIFEKNPASFQLIENRKKKREREERRG